MTRPTIQAVVFDLDDTLFPERDYVRSGYHAVADHLKQTLARDDDFDGWLWRRFQAGRAASAFDALNEHFSLGLDKPDIVRIVEVYREHRPQIAPRPGAADLLRRLRAGRHCRLGLVSDGFLPAQRLKLDALGIEPLFDAVVLTEEMGREFWKPSPAGFRAVRDMLGTADAACAYVADNPAKDFVAPNALGWWTVQLRCPGQIHSANPAPDTGQAQTVISSLDELESALF